MNFVHDFGKFETTNDQTLVKNKLWMHVKWERLNEGIFTIAGRNDSQK